MSQPVVFFRRNEQISRVFKVLYETKHNGFPVVTQHNKVVGLISRNHLITIIQNKWFIDSRVESLDRCSDEDLFGHEKVIDGEMGGSIDNR